MVLSFENTGDLSLEWELEEKTPLSWLSVNPEDGIVPPKEARSVYVTFDAAGLEMGEYTGALLVASNDPFHPTIEAPVTLKVGLFDTCLPIIVR